MDDIAASVNYIIYLLYDVGYVDNIDHLGNRRLRSVGELLQNQFRIGLSRMEGSQGEDDYPGCGCHYAQALINIRPVTASIKDFRRQSAIPIYGPDQPSGGSYP